MNIFEQIKKDHKKVRSLFKEIEFSYESLPAILPKLLNELKYEITRNIDLKEKVLYSFLSNSFEKHYFMQESRSDHKLILTQINSLALLDFNKDKYDILKHLILKHFEKETEVFHIVRCFFTKSQIDNLSNSMKIEKIKIYQSAA